MKTKFNYYCFAYFCFLAFWLAYFGIGFAKDIILDKELYKADNQTVYVADFVFFYETGLIANSDSKSNLYNPANQLKVLNEIIQPCKVDIPPCLPYPPYFFWIMQPFTLISVNVAYKIFCLSTLAFGIFGIHKLLALRKKVSNIDKLIMMMGILVSWPSQKTLILGQLTYLYVGILALFYVCTVRQQELKSGALLAVLCLKPHFILFMPIVSVALRHWKALGVLAGLVSLVVMVSALDLGLQNYFDYPSYVALAASSDSFFAMKGVYKVSLSGLLHSLFPKNIAVVISFVFLLASLLMALCLWLKAHANFSDQLQKSGIEEDNTVLYRWAMAVSMTIFIVLSPHAHQYTCLILAIPAVLTLTTVSPVEAMKLESTPFKFWTVLIVFYPLFSYINLIVSSVLEPNMDAKLYLLYNSTLLILGILCFLENKKKTA